MKVYVESSVKQIIGMVESTIPQYNYVCNCLAGCIKWAGTKKKNPPCLYFIKCISSIISEQALNSKSWQACSHPDRNIHTFELAVQIQVVSINLSTFTFFIAIFKMIHSLNSVAVKILILACLSSFSSIEPLVLLNLIKEKILK